MDVGKEDQHTEKLERRTAQAREHISRENQFLCLNYPDKVRVKKISL